MAVYTAQENYAPFYGSERHCSETCSLCVNRDNIDNKLRPVT